MMLRRATLGLALLAAPLWLFDGSALAGEPIERRLDRALAHLERGEAPGRSGLQAALADLEARHAAQQKAFAHAARRAATPLAAERLARARAAYGKGHGRLLQLLRGLSAHPAAGATPRMAAE